ncbi:MAG: urease accessory protein UreD [Gammaproteobacteria bacterium]|nr:urease accessory protein UreD [Gammaproteobacteria bacterium]
MSASPVTDGAATLSFRADRGDTVIGELYQHNPLRMLFPRHVAGEPLTGILVTTSGGLVGGDQLEVRVSSRKGTAGRVLAQAAEKIYRSTGADSRIGIRLQAETDSWLEWLPQETILFDKSRLRRSTEIRAVPGARLLCGEMVVLGRTAMGERMREGLLHEAWDVYWDDRLVWSDALHLNSGLERVSDAAAGLDGARACASTLYVGDDAPQHLGPARELINETAEEPLRVAASCVGNVLVIRWLGRDSLQLRDAYGRFWAAFRHHLAGYPPIMPRLWQT